LVVHGSAATRAQLSEILSLEGLRVEAAESTYACIARFVDAPCDLVLIGLAGLDEGELELVRTLKAESPPPRVLVSFPGPQRDLAVRALAAGADGYMLEPFYREELVALARGQLAAPASAGPARTLAAFAREVVHAVGNPLQVITLLLQKDKVTKRELMQGLPEHVARIERVVALLRDYSNLRPATLVPADPKPIVEHAAQRHKIACRAKSVPGALIDAAMFAELVDALLDAVMLRAGEEYETRLSLDAEPGAAVLTLAAPRMVFSHEDLDALLDAVFTVRPDREVLPGLARPRLLLTAQNGSLAVKTRGEELLFMARVPRG